MRAARFFGSATMLGCLLASSSSHPNEATKRLFVRLENDRVRVLELRLKPGEQEGFHTHPRYVLYALTDYRVRNTSADGKSTIFDRKAGDVVWGDPITHRGENVGATEVHALIVEIRDEKGSAFKGAAEQSVAADGRGASDRRPPLN